MDFMLQDNGKRAENFDGLNWGFSYMSGSPASIYLLECTLQLWQHSSFLPHGVSSIYEVEDSYYLRSQPRINHIVELALRDAKPPPRVCTFSNMNALARHMTGHKSSAYKILCAKSNGYLHDPEAKVMAYDVPSTGSPLDQRTVLTKALALAAALGRRLIIPRAYWGSKGVYFCLLFFFPKPDQVRHLLAANEDVSECSTTNLADVRNFQGRRLCLHFSDLLEASMSGLASPIDVTVYLCNPLEDKYKGEHICVTNQDARESLPR